MNASLVQCPACQAAVPGDNFDPKFPMPCPSCGVPVQIEIFPAFFRRFAAGREGEALMVEGESSCFYHPGKKAVRPCEGCGRFLCALCDCELNGRHFCPACLESGKTKGRIKSLENRRTLYDSIALSLAVLPLLFAYFTIITAPAAVYVSVRYWNAPRSMVHRTRIRFVVAMLLALVQIIGWIVLIYFISTAALRRYG